MKNSELAAKLKEKLPLIENLPGGLASISPPLKADELKQIIAALEADDWPESDGWSQCGSPEIDVLGYKKIMTLVYERPYKGTNDEK